MPDSSLLYDASKLNPYWQRISAFLDSAKADMTTILAILWCFTQGERIRFCGDSRVVRPDQSLQYKLDLISRLGFSKTSRSQRMASCLTAIFYIYLHRVQHPGHNFC